MKKYILILIIALFVGLQLNAQDGNAGLLSSNEQSVGISTGIDYSILPFEINYKKGFNLFNYKYPIVFGADVTIPFFDFDLNDIRIRLTSETVLLKKGIFEVRGGIDPVVCNTKMQTETMTSIGADFHVFTGVSTQKWNTGIELNYNQMVSTYIKHTDKYKENVYADVVDGWYKATASNIKIGLLVGRKFNNLEIYLKGGISKTGKFNNYLFVPTIYSIIGFNYRF